MRRDSVKMRALRLAPIFAISAKPTSRAFEQRPALGVDADAACPLRVAGELVDLIVEVLAVRLSDRCGWCLVLVRVAAKNLVEQVLFDLFVLDEVFGDARRQPACPSRICDSRVFIVSSVFATAWDDEARSFRRISAVRCRCRFGKANVFSRIRYSETAS